MDSYYDDGGCCIVHPDSTDLVLTGGKGPITQTNWSFVVSYSRNGGSTWTRCNLSGTNSGWCYALAVAPSATEIIYAGGQAAGASAVYHSTDFGATWSPTATAPTDTVWSLEVDPTDAARVLAATSDGAFLTTNSGATWINLHGGNLRAALQYPGSPDTMFAGGTAGVSISTDGGGAWNPMNSGLEGRAVTALEFADHGGDYLIAGTVGGSCYAWQFDAGIAERRWARGGGLGTAGSLQAWPNPFVSFCSIVGHARDEFILYDYSGRQVGAARGDRIGAGLAAGVYFVRGSESTTASVRIVKTK